MRILASNPDTIGDLVLREPLYRALREAGHELVLIVRPSVVALVPYIAPGARVLVLPTEVYRDDIEDRWDEFADLFRAAREANPDLLLVAPFQWTRFEERLADVLSDLPGLRRIGMNGRLYAGDPHAGHAPPSRMTFDVTASVDEASAEVEKNAALAEAVIGRRPESIEPRIEPAATAMEDARRVLAERGLTAGGYWVACVTGTVNVPIKAWPAGHWAQVLGEWAGRHGRRFLFVGLPEERPVAEEVRRLMGDAGVASSIWMEPGGSLDQLIALCSLSSGYVGHDTGPMHLAAAVGKPVLAVFGGGHWPRFVPRAVPSISLTVGVPCAGCGWACSFETSHCVKALPVAEVLRAIDDFESGRVTGRFIRTLAPTKELIETMVGEVARFAQKQLRESASLAQELRARAPDELVRLEAEREDAQRRAARLEQSLAASSAVVEELRQQLRRVTDEAAGIAAQLQERETAVVQLRTRVEATAQAAERAKQETAAARASAAVEIEQFREQMRELEERVRSTQKVRRPRRHWREIATDLVCGSREYVPRRPPRHLPVITFVVAVDGASDDAARASIESVIAQNYPHLDFAIARACAGGEAKAAGDPQAIPPEYKSSIDRVVCDSAGRFAAIARAFESSNADVLGWLDAGDTLSPGALLRAGETFRDHPRAPVVYFDDTAVIDGWHVPASARPRLDVHRLLAMTEPPRVTAFFRRREYELLGPIVIDRRTAAGWDLLVRFARRYGLRRGAGDGAKRRRGTERQEDKGTRRHGDSDTVGPEACASDASSSAVDFRAAREAFLATLGRPGRARLGANHFFNRMRFALQSAWPARWSYGMPAANDKPLPPVSTTAEHPSHVVASPLTGRPPARLLFSGRDTGAPASAVGDDRLHEIYYDPAGDVAIVHPPVALDELKAMYAARDAAASAGTILPADDRFASPWARYRGGRAWRRLLLSLPSPYWRLRKADADDPTAQRVLDILARRVQPGDESVRFLNVGCYEGTLLDRLRTLTKWQTAGTESNAAAAQVAAGKGHAVWQTSAQDAAMTIPIGRSFDVIFVSGVIEHLDDPLGVLRRLRQLLSPGGWIVLNQPNLDSRLLDLFGPTWTHWQLPYHRTLMGRRGVRRLAAMADLRVERLRTYTDPYPATASVALNEMGLGATIPEGATFPDEMSSRGARIAGWARMLWDWRGRGDYLYAVMKAM